MSESAAGRQIARIIRQQAGILALNDAFLLGACVMFLLGGLVWFAKLRKDSQTYETHATTQISGAAVTADH